MVEEEAQNQLQIPLKSIKTEETVNKEKEDRLSALPDCLVTEILSCLLSAKSAARTGILSKRWKYLWTYVPTLIFLDKVFEICPEFFSFVDKTINLRGHLKLKRFVVITNYDMLFDSQINSWIRYAISCDVEDFNLTLRSIDSVKNEAEFVLDQCIFVNSCFSYLELAGCIFNHTRAISWENLKSLNISRGKLNEDMIEKILSGSPLLEILNLDLCYGFGRLDITSKSVKNLGFSRYKIHHDATDHLADIIEINAPNILSLSIVDDLCLWKLLLLDVSSLVFTNLDYIKYGHYETTHKEAEEEMLKGFILKLRHVKELQIGSFCFKILSRLEAKGFTCPSNLKKHYITSDLNSDRDSVSDSSDSDSTESEEDWDGLFLDDGPNGDEVN